MLTAMAAWFLDGTEIARFIRRQNDIHTIAFVKDHAISAGSMIALACDEIVVSDDAARSAIALPPSKWDRRDWKRSHRPSGEAKVEAPVLEDFLKSALENETKCMILLLSRGMVDVRQIIYWVKNKETGEKEVRR